MAASFLWAEIVGAPVEPGDEIESTRQVATEHRPGLPRWRKDRIAWETFYVLIVPSLIGVYFGRKEPKDVS